MRYFRENWDDTGLNMQSIWAHSEDVDERTGRVPSALVTMRPSKELSNFHGGESIFHLYSDSGEEPTEFFTHRPPEITGAWADPTIRSVIPKMVAMRLRDMHHGGTQQVMADSSLTSFSSALSRGAARRGLAVGHQANPDMINNSDDEDVGYSDMDEYRKPVSLFNDKSFSEIDRHEQAAAKDLLRHRLGRTPPKSVRGKPQFEQLSLGF